MNDERLADWCLDRLRDAATEDAIDKDTPEHVLQREAARMEREIHALTSSFIDNTFDSTE